MPSQTRGIPEKSSLCDLGFMSGINSTCELFASSVNVNAEPLPTSSSWADVASNPQSPVGETVFMNGLSLSPPDNSSPSLLGTLGHSIVKVNSTATTTFTAAVTPQSAASVM